ncbi:hypothetical protein B0H10DRAFT_475360 [Mycena sp. CBHHK59/15]|nr:hypothetical protein B0H10DRAFT_475360 [Mycena sp. CBHHK59/15]
MRLRRTPSMPRLQTRFVPRVSPGSLQQCCSNWSWAYCTRAGLCRSLGSGMFSAKLRMLSSENLSSSGFTIFHTCFHRASHCSCRARAKADAPLPETPTAKDPLGTALALHAEDIQELSDAADVPTFSKGRLRYLFATKHLMADIHVLHMAHSDPSSNSSREGSLSSSASTTVVGGLIEVKPEPQESDVCMPDAPEPNTDPCVQEISPVQDVVLTRPKTGDLPVLTTAAIPSIHGQVKPEPTSDLRIPVLVTEPSIPRPEQQLLTAPPVYDTDLQSLIDGMDGPLFKPGTLLRTHPPLIPEPQSLQTQDDTTVTCPPRLVHPGLPPKPGPPVALHPMYREPSAAPSGPQNGNGPRQNPPIHRKPPAAPHPQGRGYYRNPNPLPPQETLKKVLLTRPAVSRQSLLERIAPRSDQENLAPLPVPVFAPEPTVPVDTRKHPPTGARAESNVRYEPYPTKHDGPYSEIYDELHPDKRHEPYSETQRPDEQHLDRRDPAQPTRRDEPRLDRRHNLYPERRCGPYRDPREEMRDEPRAEGYRGPHFGRRGDMYPDRRYEPYPSRTATG